MLDQNPSSNSTSSNKPHHKSNSKFTTSSKRNSEADQPSTSKIPKLSSKHNSVNIKHSHSEVHRSNSDRKSQVESNKSHIEGAKSRKESTKQEVKSHSEGAVDHADISKGNQETNHEYQSKLNIRGKNKPNKSSDRNKHKTFASLSFSSGTSLSNHFHSYSDPSSSSGNQTFPKISHKYALRSQSRCSNIPAPTSPEEHRKESSALGASSSQHSKREDTEPSRLARSGAVLRRSTRSSKG